MYLGLKKKEKKKLRKLDNRELFRFAKTALEKEFDFFICHPPPFLCLLSLCDNTESD